MLAMSESRCRDPGEAAKVEETQREHFLGFEI